MTLDTSGEIESISGKRAPAWAIADADPQAQPSATGGAEPPLLVVARRDLLGDATIDIEP